MAIGTDVKIGLDATAVKRGFTALRTMFGASFRGLRQIGIGAFRQVGVGLTGILGKALTFLPEQIDNLRKLSNEMSLLSAASGETVPNLMRLSKALELGGFEDGMAIDMVREMGTKLGEAMRDQSEARDALRDLGLRSSWFKGKNITESMQMLAEATRTYKGEAKQLAFIFDRLLGGDLGAKAIPFFKNFNALMKEAGTSGDAFAKTLGEQQEALQSIARLRMAFRNKMQEAILGGVAGSYNQGGIDRLISKIENFDVSRIRNAFSGLSSFFAKNFEAMLNGGTLGDVLRNYGSILGDAIGEAIKKKLPKWAGGGGGETTSLGGARPSDSVAQLGRKLDQLIADTRTGNRSLMKIENLNMGLV